MSLIDLASLVLAPTATKEGKVYSAIPDTGDGDMTFTRGSAATRVNSAGLIEKERANLLLQSNSFDTTWTQVRADYTGGQTGYDGSSDAWQVECNAVGYSGGYQNTSSLNEVNCSSLYAKAGNVDYLFISTTQGSTNNAQYFNLTNGTLGSLVGTGIIDANIESVGNGWYRCSITMSPNASFGYFLFGLSDTDGNSTGSIGGNIYIQDAMLNEGLVAQSYIETTTTAVYEGITDDVPRVDYSGGGCPSLLLEGQRTNLITQSEYFGAWTNDTNTSLTANAIQSPSGFVDAYKMSAGTSTARQAIKLLLTPSGDVVQSVFAKKGEYSVVQITDGRNPNLYANFDLENGVLGNYEDCTPSIEEFNDGWYRCVIVYNSTLDIVNTRISIAESPTQARLVNFAGNGSDGIYIWGAMVEAGSYSTSYLPTYGTSTTRVEDVCYKTGISSLIGQSEGVVFVEFNQNLIGQLATRRIFALSDGGTSNRITSYISSTNKIDFYVRNSGGDLFLGTSTSPIGNEKGVHKIACAYKDEDYAVYMDGDLIISGTGTAGTIPACSRFDLGQQIGANDLYEPISQALLFQTRLTNTELAELTKL